MQYEKGDPKGYYAVLGITTNAGVENIKSAYRRRAMQLHPDRNPGTDTTGQFQLLNEAYAILSDKTSRTEYDRFEAEKEAETPAVPEPIVCSSCGKVSAQPRMVVFRSVKSFLVVTMRKPIAGVFCSECAQKQSLKASATSWLLGWWGFPWGPIYTVQALISNMFGGTHPPLENAKMLGYQAYYFYATGRPDLAQSIAESAIKYCKKIPGSQARKSPPEIERDNLIGNLENFLAALKIDSKNNQLKSNWGLLHRRFFVHFGLISLVAGGITFAIINSPESSYSPPRGPMPYASQSSAPLLSDGKSNSQHPVSGLNIQKGTPKKALYVRPKATPNGRPWPVVAAYLPGELQTHTAGHSEVTIDNGQNNADVQLKLVSLDGKTARPARQIFIPAHSQFTIKNLTPGSYDVRYRDLTSGNLSRSESMRLTETSSSKGIRYSAVTLTLYKVANGNTSTYGLSEDEF
ncbi:J domain-containing protein [Pseudomonas sp. NPDC088885]|uniref:J domain-containing protein n=1 Tax=Pseudomonas sp. NPDC088885 TaxID=3364457 RepID=UPI0037FF5CD4